MISTEPPKADTAENDKKKRWHPSLRGPLLNLSTNLVVSVLVLAFLGYLLDKHFATNRYYFTLAGLLLGYVWSFYELMKTVRKLQQQEKNSSAKK